MNWSEQVGLGGNSGSSIGGIDTGADLSGGLESALVSLPLDEVERVVKYVEEIEGGLAQRIRSKTIPPDVEHGLQASIDQLKTREKELLAALTRRPDIKEYVIPLLVSAYLVRDNPEMVGLVLGLGAFGYENWRRGEQNRYLNALLELQDRKNAAYRVLRQWEDKNLDRARTILSQARMYYNAMTGTQLRRMRIVLTERHREYMRKLQDERVKLNMSRLYWTTFKRMEELLTQYPVHRVQIYQSFVPFLDQYATMGGFAPVHRSLETALETVRVSSLLQMFRMQRVMQQLSDWNTRRANIRGVLIGQNGNQSGILQAVRNGNLQAAVRTLQDYNTLKDTLETIKDNIGFLDSSSDEGRSALIGYARLLGIPVDPSQPEQIAGLPDKIKVQIDSLVRLDVRRLSGDQLSDEFQRQLLQVANLPGTDLDSALESLLQNSWQGAVSFWQQMESGIGTAEIGGAGAAPIPSQTPSQIPSQIPNNQQAQAQAQTDYSVYLNDMGIQKTFRDINMEMENVSSQNLISPAAFSAVNYVPDLLRSSDPRIKARAQAIQQTWQAIGGQQIEIHPPQDKPSQIEIGTGVQNGRNRVIVLLRGSPASMNSMSRANGLARQNGNAIALDIGFIKQSPQDPRLGSEPVYVPVLIASIRIVPRDVPQYGARVPISFIPIANNSVIGHVARGDGQSWNQMGIQIKTLSGSEAQVVNSFVNNFNAFLSNIMKLDQNQLRKPEVRAAVINEFNRLVSELYRSNSGLTIVFGSAN